MEWDAVSTIEFREGINTRNVLPEFVKYHAGPLAERQYLNKAIL